MSEEKNCIYCKHLQIYRMLRAWCDIYGHDWGDIGAEYCSEFTTGDVE